MSDLGDRGLGLDRLSSGYRGGRRYDPNQPRVPRGHPDGGQWTDEDGVPARSSPVPSPAAIPAPAAPPPPALPPIGVAAGLAGMAAVAFTAAMTTFSRSIGKVEECALRHFPGLRYRYDDGFLTIHGPFNDGAAPLLFHGRADKDALFRLRDGTILGRERPTSIALNDVGIALAEERHQERIRSRTRLGALEDEPKLCPEETPERPTNDELRWRLYQYQVTGTTPGYAIVFGGREFDGCREDLAGILQEAKGPGYADMMIGGEFRQGWKVTNKLLEQLYGQSVAAGDRAVQWIVAEKPVAEWLSVRAKSLPNVVILEEEYIEPDQATMDWVTQRSGLAR